MVKIKLSDIIESPKNVRSSRDEMAFTQLIVSIKKHGVIVPIKVRPTEEGEYEIVYGHRRVAAARKAGLDEIEAMVEGLNDRRTDIQALIENEVREDLSLMDRARTYRRLHDELGLAWDEIGASLGKSARRIEEVAAYVDEPVELTRYLETPPAKRGKREPSKLGAWQVQEITRALGDDVDAKIAVADKAVREGLTGEQTKKVARVVAAEKHPEKRRTLLETDARSPAWRELAEIRAKARREKEAKWWDKHPSTKEFLGLLKMYGRLMRSAWESARKEKIAPDHLHYLIGRIREFVAYLEEIIQQLEVKAAKYQ